MATGGSVTDFRAWNAPSEQTERVFCVLCWELSGKPDPAVAWMTGVWHIVIPAWYQFHRDDVEILQCTGCYGILRWRYEGDE
jgi:hypothetical protein